MADDKPVTSEQLGHEPTAVSARAVSIGVAVLLVGIVTALLLMAGLIVFLTSIEGGEPHVRPPGTAVAPPPGIPAVDANQTDTLRQLRAREQALLTGYEWVDRDEGVARIPIGRAMEIVAQEIPRTPELPDEEMAAQ